ncbi:unnamed protein product [Kluyveromyces dobzhanskii CBS 2104]|uniref:WGS project CCBQ000000000 data, contig 00099 n=1 Tax=Kluyveromyces dobzhanskii CBS 2104 TaxID=1427455 RepID=A0A0A8L424_9SACH|nr:unnamed protein product [Kluyveromyces dobzhanskii CBS 2104]
MTEGRRLSNRSSIRNITHLLNDIPDAPKTGRFKTRNNSGPRQSPTKQHIKSSLPILEVQNMEDVDIPNVCEQLSRISEPPGKNMNYDSPKINVKFGFFNSQASKVIYKLDVPISNNSDVQNSTKLDKLIHESHQSNKPFKLCNDDDFCYESLDSLPDVLNKYISHRMNVQAAPQRLKTKHVYNRVDQLLVQENQFLSANDNSDLSFDGKAMDKNDVFRIVDSFSVAFDDDEEDTDEQYAKQPRNILTREITGVF